MKMAGYEQIRRSTLSAIAMFLADVQIDALRPESEVTKIIADSDSIAKAKSVLVAAWEITLTRLYDVEQFEKEEKLDA